MEGPKSAALPRDAYSKKYIVCSTILHHDVFSIFIDIFMK